MIKWIDINNTPINSIYYLVEFEEYIGINIIKGYKIVKWNNGFYINKYSRATRYAKIPETIIFKKPHE